MLTATIEFLLNGTLTKALDLATAKLPVAIKHKFPWTDGEGPDQAEELWADQRTLAASANEELDLAGVLANAFGDTITFTRIKAILIKAAAGNTNNVLVGGAATNAFGTWVGDATDVVVVRPGGLLALIAPDATAYAVTAGTGDKLKIANSGGGTAVTYDIVLIGTK